MKIIEMFQMQYLYHRVSKNMIGTVLYPLNKLKYIYPEIYDQEIKKYEGREKLLVAKVPPLDCFWNDVLHLTAVTPEQLRFNLAKAGIDNTPTKFFKIPVSMIEGQNSIAFIYRRDIGLIPDFKQYEVFNPDRMDVYREVPNETIEYYKQKKSEGVKPLLYHLVPHILYKGDIDIKNLEIEEI